MYAFLRRQKVISLRPRSLLQFFVYGKSVRPARDSRTSEQSHKKNRFRIVLSVPVFENFIGGSGVVAVIPEKDFVAHKMIECGNSFPYRQNHPAPAIISSCISRFLQFKSVVRTFEKFPQLLYVPYIARRRRIRKNSVRCRRKNQKTGTFPIRSSLYCMRHLAEIYSSQTRFSFVDSIGQPFLNGNRTINRKKTKPTVSPAINR